MVINRRNFERDYGLEDTKENRYFIMINMFICWLDNNDSDPTIAKAEDEFFRCMDEFIK